jgi:D-Tyr-tRNAtyr deacylase
MAVPLKYPNVNWVNGMKIRKEHFVQQDNAVEDKIKDVASCFLSENNYGLLPVTDSTDSSCKVVLKVDNQKFLKVSVFQLRAVTQGGARIEILENVNPQEFSVDLSKAMEASRKEENGAYMVTLTVDLFNREPFGLLSEEEEPPRFPFTSPSLSMNLFSEKEMAQKGMIPFALIIGKLQVLPDRVDVLGDYVPSSVSLRSHTRLMNFHSMAEKFFNQMEISLLSIIGKIKEKGQDSSLALSVLQLAEALLGYVTVNNLKIRWLLPDQPPVCLFETIGTFARVMRNTIDSNTAAQKEEMINYFTNWSELKQGDFEKLLVYCINFAYNHREISVSMDQFGEFLQIMTSLFAKLESLAYIGKKKETNIFVKENTAKRSFLAD